MIKKLLAAIFLLAFFAAVALAQSNPEKAIQDSRDQFFNIKNRSIEMERMKREANRRPESADDRAKFPMIKEDFEEIQKLNSRVFSLAATKTEIDTAAVLKFVSEINHRAARLKSNLFAVDSEEKKEEKNKQQAIDSKDLKKLVGAMDKAVNSFVHSSIFQNINVVNPDDSLKAEKDLENVIKISNAIKIKTKN